ncbi:hypothetical protein MLD38_037561 [Melastoma candidum]|uniref:Uncharacterized protein n=1 Tax=Melastoma candidum TaxID=119954 RepID=A0ACB9LN26_9MYRT|nr:hypothetical protein MLD38_037561 [Melastoma candidum]
MPQARRSWLRDRIPSHVAYASLGDFSSALSDAQKTLGLKDYSAAFAWDHSAFADPVLVTAAAAKDDSKADADLPPQGTPPTPTSAPSPPMEGSALNTTPNTFVCNYLVNVLNFTGDQILNQTTRSTKVHSSVSSHPFPLCLIMFSVRCFDLGSATTSFF